ncbi:MAG: SURF1 family protein [Hyphomicrobium sp.]
MLARWRAAGLVWPALMTLVMLPVLVGLGTWQWQRKAWKEGLISRIAERTKAEPVSLEDALQRTGATGDVEYLRVRVTGTFDHATERHFYAPTTASQGWHVFTVLRTEGTTPRLVYINRGWVPDKLKLAATRADGQVAGPVTVTGLVRLPELTGMFAPPNDPDKNRWYRRDPNEMQWNGLSPAQRQRLEQMAKLQAVAPFSLDAEADPANPGGWPKGGTTEFHIPNRHLEYVLTWYGFALTLLVVFAVFARQRLAATRPPAGTT